MSSVAPFLAGLLSKAPSDPYGEHFFISPQSKIGNHWRSISASCAAFQTRIPAKSHWEDRSYLTSAATSALWPCQTPIVLLGYRGSLGSAVAFKGSSLFWMLICTHTGNFTNTNHFHSYHKSIAACNKGPNNDCVWRMVILEWHPEKQSRGTVWFDWSWLDGLKIRTDAIQP